MTLATIVNYTFAILTVVGQLLVLKLVFWSIFKDKIIGKNIGPFAIGDYTENMLAFFTKHGMFFAFIIALVAMLGSLTYSDILMYEPCKLCWFQRICMYPLVVLLGLGLVRKDSDISFYALVLAILGAPIAFYHYLVQLGLIKAGCSTVGYSVSCAKYFTMSFGYITIPMMALTAFAMIIAFLALYRKGLNDSASV